MMYRILSFVFIVLCFSCSSTKDVVTFTVASEQSDCVGMVPRKCLLVKRDGQTNWQNFYSNIEGFNYESGYEYVLKVKEETIENQPADGSSPKYVLVTQVSRVKK